MADPTGTPETSFVSGLDFDDGDVMIVLSATVRYKVHSSVLKSHSRLFRSLLTSGNAAELSGKSKQRTNMRYRLELVERPQNDEAGAGVLELIVSHPDLFLRHYPNRCRTCTCFVV